MDILTTRDLEKEDRGTEGTVIYEKQDLIPTAGKRLIANLAFSNGIRVRSTFM